MKYVLKIDLDLKLPKRWLMKWERSRVGLLASLGYEVTDLITRRSSRRGYHIWIHIYSEGKLSDKDINLLQYLCGDDGSRVLINAYRIKRGVAHWNKLFSKVLFRKKHKCNCQIHQKFLQKEKEGQKFIKGALE